MSIKQIILFSLVLIFIVGCQKPREIVYDKEIEHNLSPDELEKECAKYVKCESLYRVQPKTPEFCCHETGKIMEVKYGELIG